jgi:ubiquinone/menaquinone biosynthesis C-methylase UbiE
MLGNRTQIGDLVDLALFRLAKSCRPKLRNNVQDFYEEFFTCNDNVVFNSGFDRRKKYKAEILNSAIVSKLPQGGAILDVGCGVGDNLRSIERNDLKLFGIEYASASVEFAKSSVSGKAVLFQGSATKLPFRSEKFDLVLCIEVLEHIEDQHKALHEIRRVLKADGKLVLSVPYRHWFPVYYTHMGHYRHYTRSGLVQLLNSAGFSNIGFLPNHPKWSRLANYCYVVCRAAALMQRLLGRRIFPHDVRLPFMKKRLIDVLFDRIEFLRRWEHCSNCGTLETSTYVHCTRS